MAGTYYVGDDSPYVYHNIPDDVKDYGLTAAVDWLEERKTSPWQHAPELNEVVEVCASDVDLVYENGLYQAEVLRLDAERNISIRNNFGVGLEVSIANLPAYTDVRNIDKTPKELFDLATAREDEAETDRANAWEELNSEVYECDMRYPGLITDRTKACLEGYDVYAKQRSQEEQNNKTQGLGGIDVTRDAGRQGSQQLDAQRGPQVQQPGKNHSTGNGRRSLPKGYEDYQPTNPDSQDTDDYGGRWG